MAMANLTRAAFPATPAAFMEQLADATDTAVLPENGDVAEEIEGNGPDDATDVGEQNNVNSISRNNTSDLGYYVNQWWNESLARGTVAGIDAACFLGSPLYNGWFQCPTIKLQDAFHHWLQTQPDTARRDVALRMTEPQSRTCKWFGRVWLGMIGPGRGLLREQFSFGNGSRLGYRVPPPTVLTNNVDLPAQWAFQPSSPSVGPGSSCFESPDTSNASVLLDQEPSITWTPVPVAPSDVTETWNDSTSPPVSSLPPSSAQEMAITPVESVLLAPVIPTVAATTTAPAMSEVRTESISLHARQPSEDESGSRCTKRKPDGELSCDVSLSSLTRCESNIPCTNQATDARINNDCNTEDEEEGEPSGTISDAPFDASGKKKEKVAEPGVECLKSERRRYVLRRGVVKANTAVRLYLKEFGQKYSNHLSRYMLNEMQQVIDHPVKEKDVVLESSPVVMTRNQECDKAAVRSRDCPDVDMNTGILTCNCRICLGPVNFQQNTRGSYLAHVTPFSRGGSNRKSNTAYVCGPCNPIGTTKCELDNWVERATKEQFVGMVIDLKKAYEKENPEIVFTGLEDFVRLCFGLDARVYETDDVIPDGVVRNEKVYRVLREEDWRRREEELRAQWNHELEEQCAREQEMHESSIKRIRLLQEKWKPVPFVPFSPQAKQTTIPRAGNRAASWPTDD